jgi:protein gp37
MKRERREKGLFWDRAWKLVEGCSKVSPGCHNCWSETETVMRANHPNPKIAQRANAVMVFDDGFCGNILLRQDNLDLPLRTKKPTVWAVWNDLYHPDVPLSFLCDAIQTMERARKLGHVFLVLTKRADRMGDFLETIDEPVPDHVWHGVSVENQQSADERILHLLKVPGKRFVNCEPLLSEIDLYRAGFSFPAIDAVLAGGESGKFARPCHPGWARSLRDQCAVAGVPFYWKQNGEFASVSDVEGAGYFHVFPGGATVRRVGKAKAGRTIDGRTHNELPWD